MVRESVRRYASGMLLQQRGQLGKHFIDDDLRCLLGEGGMTGLEIEDAGLIAEHDALG